MAKEKQSAEKEYTVSKIFIEWLKRNNQLKKSTQ